MKLTSPTSRPPVFKFSLALTVAAFTMPGIAAAEPVEMVVGAPAPVAALWPVFVAQSQGFFAEHDLDVSVRFAGGGQGLQQLLSNDLQVFVTNPDQPALVHDRGAPIKGFMGMINSPFSLLGAPGIENFDDLKGKRIGTGAIASSDATLISAIVTANGLQASDFEIFQTGSGANKIAALASGNVAAVTLTQPQDVIYLASDPTAKRLALSSDVLETQTIAAFYNRDWIEDHQDALKGFVAAVKDAKTFLQDDANKDAAVTILSGATNIDAAIAQEVYELYEGQGLFDSALDLDMDKLNSFLGLAREAGLGDFTDASDYFDTTWLEASQ